MPGTFPLENRLTRNSLPDPHKAKQNWTKLNF